MSEFHDEYPQYEFLAQHTEAEGGPKRKALWRVFWIMLLITLVELFVGFKAKDFGLLDELQRSGAFLKMFFIGLTIAKAFYIVYSFMHLGHEVRWLKWVIIAPFTAFILYLIFMATIGEGLYVGKYNLGLDKHVVEQQKMLRSGHSPEESSGAEATEGSEHHEGAEAEHKEGAAAEHGEEHKEEGKKEEAKHE